ncbi:MAG TPA: ABC transporter permease [Acidobacteriaceae bacterium]|jgi:ABC-2 type transport system permease protein|nr:ABC transporter permease [Acidobacteriaceae bacterium]
MLRNTLLIAKREYLERVRSKVFRITTVLVPVGMGGVALLGGIGGRHLEAGIQHVAVVSNDAPLAQQVKDALSKGEHSPKTIDVYAPATAADVDRVNQQVTDHSIGGYLTIEDKPGSATPDAAWVSGSSTDFIGKAQMGGAVTEGLVREQLLQRGMSDDQVHDLMKHVKLETKQVKNGQVVSSDTARSFAGAYALILVLYGAVLIYGINIARSVVEEKTSRVFEVLLSTASADDLMLGKLLGVGATGLTQMLIWAALVGGFAGSQLAANQGIHGLSSLGITRPELVFFGIFFILGFYLYSAVAAALGSSVSGEQEIQQFSFILISPLIISVVMLPYVLGNPSSTASVILSLLPPFTPIIMYMRICSQMPPYWQILLSIALLTASVWAMIWLAARVYRVGILMYGKRATLPEMIRWLRYS